MELTCLLHISANYEGQLEREENVGFGACMDLLFAASSDQGKSSYIFPFLNLQQGSSSFLG